MGMLHMIAAATAPVTQQAGEPLPAWESWIFYVVGATALIASGVFAGAEIGIFSISRVRLRLRTARKERRALLLNEWLREPTYALEGLLILQNIANFVFAAIVTRVFSSWGFGHTGEMLLSIAVVEPMILIFADIMPKDLFHTYADRWIYRLVPVLKWMFRLLTWVGLLPLVNVLSRMSMWVVGASKNPPAATGPRTEILTLFEESAATGVLTGTQQDLVQRALRLGRISVREVMIPWNRVVGAPSRISNDGFRAMVRRYNVSRMPVLGNSTTEVLGIIDVIDALSPRPSADGVAAPFKITNYVHPAMTLIGEQSVRSAITLMQRARQTVAIVVDRHGRAIGLVTMKDLIEELVGDLENW
jgi:CBS domain containing-hemolysin-like protein